VEVGAEYVGAEVFGGRGFGGVGIGGFLILVVAGYLHWWCRWRPAMGVRAAMVSVAAAGMLLAQQVAAAEVDSSAPKLSSMFTFATVVQGLCVAVFVGIIIMKLKAPKLNLPPGPIALPIVGNWLQVS
jgi:hypothetical protein